MKKKKTVGLKYKGKKFKIELVEVSEFGKIKGLMFCRKEKAEALLFKFKKPTTISIHSYFVRFPFLAIWLDVMGKVIEVKKVEPSTASVKPNKPFAKLIEIPINERYKDLIELLDES